MLYLILKYVISAAVVVGVAELSKRSSFAGSLLASLPLLSVLAMVWLWVDTRDANKVSELSTGVFWLVLPSLILFLVLPVLLKRGVAFPAALILSILAMLVGYGLMTFALSRLGIKV